MEKKAKGWEDKFVKLKEVYQKLREEHIALIRQKADADKKLSVAEAAVKDSTKKYAELNDALELTKSSAKDYDAQLDSLKKVNEENIKELSSENQELHETKDNLKVTFWVVENWGMEIGNKFLILFLGVLYLLRLCLLTPNNAS